MPWASAGPKAACRISARPGRETCELLSDAHITRTGAMPEMRGLTAQAILAWRARAVALREEDL
jgi:hypothetical protein